MNAASPSLRFAGALWLLAGLCYLASETAAAMAFPGYSYARNYISDLGVPYVGSIDGRSLNSPLAEVMNIGGFVLDGAFFALAAIMARRTVGTAARADNIFLILALMHSLGTILVGAVHSGPREVAAGIQQLHVIGAGMAILGGNAALIAAAAAARRFGAPRYYRLASVMLGSLGLIAIAVLEIGGTALPAGLLERASVYPITLWEIATGIAILARRGKPG